MIGAGIVGFDTALAAGVGAGVVAGFKLFEHFAARNGNRNGNPGYGIRERTASLETTICDLRKNVNEGFARIERRLERMETTKEKK